MIRDWTEAELILILDNRLDELAEQLREDDSRGHIASLIRGEMDGVDWVKQRILEKE